VDDLVQPVTWADALAAKSERPELLPIAGGTDVMVDLNFDRFRPEALLDLTRVSDPDVVGWSVTDGVLTLGIDVTYAQVLADLAELAPGLALASRTVGSPQIRNRGTVVGNLGSASPAGDAHPPLLAAGASVEVESVAGRRLVPVAEFFLGPKRSALRPDELIRGVHVPVATGPQQFSKIGTRNAMVIAVTSFALALHPSHRRVGTGIGSAGPTPLQAPEAEELLASSLDWESGAPVAPEVRDRFGTLVGEAAAPIDDVRGTADYRRHALSVMAGRTLSWAWEQYRSGELVGGET
jgi:CO/xanthine dehydrogenase FAD-binding subunit